MNEEYKQLIEHYRAYTAKGMSAEDVLALAVKDGHKITIGMGLLIHLFGMSIDDSRNVLSAYYDKIGLTKKFGYSEIVKVNTDRNDAKSINNSEGHVATATHNPITGKWSYGVTIPTGEGQVYNLMENELQATGKKVKPIKKQGIIQGWAEVTKTGYVLEIIKKLKYDYFEIVKIKSAEVKFSHVTGKNAVILSKVIVENFPQQNKYGLYILNDQNEMQFYIRADERQLEPTGKKLPYSFEFRPKKFDIESLKSLVILSKANSSLKLTDEIRFAIREAFKIYNFMEVFNKSYDALVYVNQEIRVGDTLLNAHGPHADKFELQDIDLFETPFSLPRQEFSTPCPDNLFQVEINFTMKINRGTDQKPLEFRPYFLSILVNTKDATIWDARGKLAEAEG